MWLYLGDVANWLAARAIDSLMRGEAMPDRAFEFGIALAATGALVLLGWTVRAVLRRARERHEPPAEDVEPWWATKAREAEPEPELRRRYRGKRRRTRVVPAHPEPVTQVIPRTSGDPDATAVIPRAGRR